MGAISAFDARGIRLRIAINVASRIPKPKGGRSAR
jgi:hypothetical protein